MYSISEYFYQTGEEREAILQLEEELLNSELEIPVYFAEVSTPYFSALTLIFTAVILMYGFCMILGRLYTLHSQKHSSYPVLRIRIRDPVPFYAPGSWLCKKIRIRDEQPGSYFRELRKIFWVKNT